MQRGVGHVPTIPSLRNTYLAIHTWATTKTSSSLRPCTVKASQCRLQNGLSGQIQRRFNHGKHRAIDGAKTQWPLGYQPDPFEKRVPWEDTRPDIVKGKVDWKYMQSERHAESQANRHEWDYEVQRNENPEHAKYLRFWINAAWFLRIIAKDLGFYVAPDGFVRISDALRFPPFSQFDGEEFATRLCMDPDDRFEVARLPDMVNGKLQDVYWVRARARHKIPGVVPVNKRIIQAEVINTAICLTSPRNSSYIKKWGIPPSQYRLINLEKDLEACIFEDEIPERQQYLCVTIDCVAATNAGVTFYHTDHSRLFATVPPYISESGHIPRLALRSAVLLDMSMKRLYAPYRLYKNPSVAANEDSGAAANEDNNVATNENVKVATNGNDNVATNRNVADARKRDDVSKRRLTPPAAGQPRRPDHPLPTPPTSGLGPVPRAAPRPAAKTREKAP